MSRSSLSSSLWRYRPPLYHHHGWLYYTPARRTRSQAFYITAVLLKASFGFATCLVDDVCETPWDMLRRNRETGLAGEPTALQMMENCGVSGKRVCSQSWGFSHYSLWEFFLSRPFVRVLDVKARRIPLHLLYVCFRSCAMRLFQRAEAGTQGGSFSRTHVGSTWHMSPERDCQLAPPSSHWAFIMFAHARSLQQRMGLGIIAR